MIEVKAKWDSHIEILDTLFRYGSFKNYFEWGMGYYSTSLALNYKKEGYIENIFCVESNEEFIKKYNYASKDIELNLYKPDQEEYIKCFSECIQNEKSLILVDDRNRVNCLHYLMEHDLKDMVVVIHDTYRAKYEKGFSVFPYIYSDYVNATCVCFKDLKTYNYLVRYLNEND